MGPNEHTPELGRIQIQVCRVAWSGICRSFPINLSSTSYHFLQSYLLSQSNQCESNFQKSICAPLDFDGFECRGGSRISQRGRQLPNRVRLSIILQTFFAKNCMKMKEFGSVRGVSGTHLDRPLCLSACGEVPLQIFYLYADTDPGGHRGPDPP